MKNTNKDYSFLIPIGMLSMPILFFILIFAASSISARNQAIKNKDKFVKIGENSLGCEKYKYNSDIVWKCPKDVGVTQIDEEECSMMGKVYSCKTASSPVVVDKDN